MNFELSDRAKNNQTRTCLVIFWPNTSWILAKTKLRTLSASSSKTELRTTKKTKLKPENFQVQPITIDNYTTLLCACILYVLILFGLEKWLFIDLHPSFDTLMCKVVAKQMEVSKWKIPHIAVCGTSNSAIKPSIKVPKLGCKVNK